MMRFLTPILILIVAGVVFFYFTDPVLSEIDTLQARQAELDGALENARKLLALQDSLLADYNNFTEENKADLDRMMPNNIDNVRLIIAINNIAENYGLTVKNPAITGNQEEEQSEGRQSSRQTEADNSVVISFSVTTSYEVLKVFLDDLAHSLRLVDIEDISFAAGADRNLSDYKVSLRTYWFK